LHLHQYVELHFHLIIQVFNILLSCVIVAVWGQESAIDAHFSCLFA
jgi:hypothetical protein